MLFDLDQFPKDWVLTPVRDKKAYREGWPAGTSRDDIKADLMGNRANGVALILGEKTGIVAIDLDGLGASRLWAQWQEECGEAPKTVEWTSGREGRKCLIFSIPQEYWGSSQSCNYGDGDQIEIRWGNRGQTLPGSIHPETGRPYFWIHSPADTEVAIAPDWLIEKMLPDPEPQRFTTPSLPVQPRSTSIPIPIEVCMSTRDRDDLSRGVPEGGRNHAAFRIAVNAIATEEELRRLGYLTSNTAEQVYWDFCRLCGLDQDREEHRAAQATWASAIKSSRGTSLTEDALINCANAYIYRETRQTNGRYPFQRTTQSLPQGNLERPQVEQLLTCSETMDSISAVLEMQLDEISEFKELIDIESRSELKGPRFKDAVKACRSACRPALLEQEIQTFKRELDPTKRSMMKAKICGRYGISGYDFKSLLEETENREQIPSQSVFTVDELLNKEVTATSYLVPGILPRGEMVILAALPKVGKTLFAFDLAHAVLSGGTFLGEKVEMGKVLLICSDQSERSTQIRLRLRGTGDIDGVSDRFRFMSYLDVEDLSTLQVTLDWFRPDLVVIDSLTSISQNSSVSENDASFVKPFIKMRDLIQSYGASSVLIHHENKSREQIGAGKVAGSSRLVSIPYAIWQLKGTINKEGDVEGDSRYLKITPRGGERITLSLDIKPKDQWLDGIYEFKGELGIDDETRSYGDRILQLLKKFSPRGLEISEIEQHLNLSKSSIYKPLDRLEDRRIVGRRRSTSDRRKWVYYVESDKPSEVTQNVGELNPKTTPRLSNNDETVQQPKSYTYQGLQESNGNRDGYPHGDTPLPSERAMSSWTPTQEIDGDGANLPLNGQLPSNGGVASCEMETREEDASSTPIHYNYSEMSSMSAGVFVRALLKCSCREEVDEIKFGINALYGKAGQDKVARSMSKEQRRYLKSLPAQLN